MSGFTQGTWSFDESSRRVWGNDDVLVCNASISWGRITRDESIANGHLLAAAPDLLAALRPLAAIPIEDFDMQDKPDRKLTAWNDVPLYVRDILSARAAIAKATGAA